MEAERKMEGRCHTSSSATAPQGTSTSTPTRHIRTITPPPPPTSNYCPALQLAERLRTCASDARDNEVLGGEEKKERSSKPTGKKIEIETETNSTVYKNTTKNSSSISAGGKTTKTLTTTTTTLILGPVCSLSLMSSSCF